MQSTRITTNQKGARMQHEKEFFIGGKWVRPASKETKAVINPANGQQIAEIAMGNREDAQAAIAAARKAFESYASTTVDERIELLKRVIEVYSRRENELVDAIVDEVGSPVTLAQNAQVPMGRKHLETALMTLKTFEFEERLGDTQIIYEPIGVCALITPWNWPLNQIAAKVGPALAAGCTMVLKPSEIAPLSGLIFASILEEAGVPAGVFNLINGDGRNVGSELSSHSEVDMVSFTGSTRAGIQVAQGAAPTVKRVAQELGGKSANILLDDVDITAAVQRDVAAAYSNTGQSCNALTRLLVPASKLEEAVEAAREVTETIILGDPKDATTQLGPVISVQQFEQVQALIRDGIDEGACVVTGGLGQPDGLDSGYYVKPTVFSNVTPQMRIAREEIFGPVVAIIPYQDDEHAVQIANDSIYGLSGGVSSADPQRAAKVARQIRTGMIHINGTPLNPEAPFGGYRMSGNGREFGMHGLKEFLEVKSLFGYPATQAG